MLLTVTKVSIPAMSTIGYGTGIDDNGNEVKFIGDHRPMRHIGEAMRWAKHDEPVEVDVEDWQIVSHQEVA
jgi:hypothetical protein